MKNVVKEERTNFVDDGGMVLFQKEHGAALIALNRPEKLNALNGSTLERLMELLDICERDDEISFLILSGSGERAFCAGGDVKSVYELGMKGDLEGAKKVFELEFAMDFRIANFPKPIVSYLDGIVMGGGIGISISTDFRLVTERTKWAMPEMKIGLFPDVGTSYYLSRLESGFGHYICLTSRTLCADDCLYLGLADYKIDSGRWTELKRALLSHIPERMDRTRTLQHLRGVIERFAQPAGESELVGRREEIARYFDHETLEEILAALQAGESAFASGIREELAGHSPTSMAVVVEQHKRARGYSLQECFDQDYMLIGHFLEDHDFYEGVRKVLVEKSGDAVWKPSDVAGVRVEKYFAV